jgi:hypothetical protein
MLWLVFGQGVPGETGKRGVGVNVDIGVGDGIWVEVGGTVDDGCAVAVIARTAGIVGAACLGEDTQLTKSRLVKSTHSIFIQILPG